MNVIMEVIAEAWDESPARVLAAIAALPFVVIGAWAGLVVFLVALS